MTGRISCSDMATLPRWRHIGMPQHYALVTTTPGKLDRIQFWPTPDRAYSVVLQP